jgi:hypothetical protein
VTSAFIACIYALVACSVLATGILGTWFSLTVSVGAVAVVLILVALTTSAWQLGLLMRASTGSSTWRSRSHSIRESRSRLHRT